MHDESSCNASFRPGTYLICVGEVVDLARTVALEAKRLEVSEHFGQPRRTVLQVHIADRRALVRLLNYLHHQGMPLWWVEYVPDC